MRIILLCVFLGGTLITGQAVFAQNHPDPETMVSRLDQMAREGSDRIQGPALIQGGERLEILDFMQLELGEDPFTPPRTQVDRSSLLRKVVAVTQTDSVVVDYYQFWRNSEWKTSYREIVYFNPDGSYASYDHESWDFGTLSWTGMWRGEWTWDSYGELVELRFQRWINASGKYENWFRLIHNYDSLWTPIELLTEVLNQSWNKTTRKWVTSGRTLYSYNIWGQVIEDLRQTWSKDQSVFIDRAKFLSRYDNDRNIAEYSYLIQDGTGTAWIPYWRYLYTYDNYGHETDRINQFWLQDSSRFENTYHNISTYDSNGKLNDYLIRSWNESLQIWTDYKRYFYTHNADGRLTEVLLQGWHDSASAWSPSERTYWAYDGLGDFESKTLQYWDPSYTRWENIRRRTTIEPQDVIVLDIETKPALPKHYALHSNYPNPFNPSTRLRYDLPKAGPANLTVYDIQGRAVRILLAGEQSAGAKELLWDARDERGHPVPSGVYFARLTAPGFARTIKMVLLR